MLIEDKDSFKMKFSIGTNFDFRLIDEIDKHNREGCITSVFGKIRSDFIGGGRASLVLPDVSINKLGEYIDVCHKKNIKFNYLMNPMCYANREFVRRYHLKLMRYLEKLAQLGVDMITINSPYLCELIKAQFPNYKVTVGLYACVDSLQMVRYWEALGADEITLARHERNFPQLEHLLSHTAGTGTGLRLMANSICLYDCAFGIAHGTSQAHASRKRDCSKDLPMDYFALKCNYERIKNPVKIISSRWIRPEDVHYYEAICSKTGNRNFSLKLLDRTRTTDFLTRVLRAYTSRSYNGNLIDLLNWPSNKELEKIHMLSAYVKAIAGLYSLEMRAVPRLFDLPPIYVDNKKLDGFVDAFVAKNECEYKYCDDVGWGDECREDGNTCVEICSYCRTWAEKAITYDDKQVNNWMKKQDDFLAKMVKGKHFITVKSLKRTRERCNVTG